MMRMHLALPALASLVSASLLAGCPGREVSAVDPRQAKELDKEIPINLSRDIDLLFVIDNSISMRQEQDSLLANFDDFIAVLESVGGGLPNVHIGVVSSDMGIGGLDAGNCAGNGDNGAFRLGESDSCNLNGDGWITSEPANFTGTLTEAFQCIADLGTNGCGFEQHLESMKAALSSPGNAGFLRDDAFLAVIVIADEDDCSAQPAQAANLFDTSQDDADSEVGFFTSFRCWEFGVVCNDDSPAPRDMPGDGTPSGRANCVPRDDSPYMEQVQTYVDFLKGLKNDPNRIVVAGIIGDAEPVQVQRENIDDDADVEYKLMPSCETAGIGEAAPATRLGAFLDAFPNRNTRQTICPSDGNLAGALNQIAELLRRITGTPCIEGLLSDTDEGAAGIQPECRVSDIQFKGSDSEVENVIPSCDNAGGATPCYTIAASADCTGDEFPTGLAISVDYGGGSEPPETTRVVRCLVD